MRIIPVLDLKGGRAVHAKAGDRGRYEPLRSVFHPTPDPVELARGLLDQFGATEVYVADLDAIEGRSEPAWGTFRAILDLGLTLRLDLGIEDGPLDPRLASLAKIRVVAATETLRGPQALARIVEQVGPERITLSLDLRQGFPILPHDSTWLGDLKSESNLVAQAVEAGARSIIRLDLLDVGTGRGVANIPPTSSLGPPGLAIEWIAGGGVSSLADLETLAHRGYSAALVGSAIHDGRIKINAISATDETRMEHG